MPKVGVGAHGEWAWGIKKAAASSATALYHCDPSGARTQDPNIKSVVLYQLS